MKTISKKMPNTLLSSIPYVVIKITLNKMAKDIPNQQSQSEKEQDWVIHTDLNRKLNTFRNLKENWDSYHANKIEAVAITKAKDILEDIHSDSFLIKNLTINIFPMRDGGVQFEFDGKDICAELEISPNGSLTFFSFNDEGKIKQTRILSHASELSTLLEDIIYA